MRSSGCAFWAAAVAASDGGDTGLGRVVLAGDRERHKCGAAVLGELAAVAPGQRRLTSTTLGVCWSRLTTSLTPAVSWGVRSNRAAALNQHMLVGLVGEVGLRDRAVGGARLAVALVLVGDLLLADRAAEHERDDDEGQPSEDGGLSMPRAPAGRARRKVSGWHAMNLAPPPARDEGRDPVSTGGDFPTAGGEAARRSETGAPPLDGPIPCPRCSPARPRPEPAQPAARPRTNRSGCAAWRRRSRP